MPGRERCRLHNGNARRGTDHPRFRHGLYSKCLKRDLRAEYERLLASPELLSAHTDVAALWVRLQQLAPRLGTGESSTRWTQLQEALGEFRRASRAGETARMLSSLNHIDGLITGAVDDESSWGDFAAMVDRVTLIAAREHRRIADEQLVVSVADIHVLVASIADCVLREVRDPSARTRIAQHIEKLRVLDRVELDGVVQAHSSAASALRRDLAFPARAAKLAADDLPGPSVKLRPAAIVLQGVQYRVFLGRLTWDDARQRCKKLGGELAVLDTPEKQAFISKELGEIAVHVGAHKDAQGRWVWASGKPVAKDDWAPGRRVQFGPRSHLFASSVLGDGTDGVEVAGVIGYVCEWPAR